MGNYTSKLFANHGENDNKTKSQTHNGSENFEKHQCTPIMTRRSLLADPRSATVGIDRTPIVLDSTPTGAPKSTASAIPKYLQTKPYLETDIDSVMAALTPEHLIPDPRSPNVIHQRTPIVKTESKYSSPNDNVNNNAERKEQGHLLSELDPRSPTINIDRTPIMKPKSPGHTDKMSHDYVAKCDVESSSLPMSYCETTIDYMIPEVQALPEIASCKPLSFEKRLNECDDNLDCHSLESETNTDVSSEESDSEGQITVIPNMNPLTNQSKVLEIHDEHVEEIEDELVKLNNCNQESIVLKSIPDGEKNQNDNGKIRVWRDSLSPSCLPESKVEVFKQPEEIIIEFDDEQSVVKHHNKVDTVAGMTDENKMSNCLFAVKRKTQQLNKDIKLIYDDTNEYNGSAIIGTQINRMPLGNRSNNHKAGVPIKSPQHLLKNIGLSTKSQQQENTPPRTKRGKSKNKLNGTQWDLDRTVVI
ncbi:hypothetical protein PV328_000254 [Microctonus aethiopoides]|uniref:Uncharacterized protein n=1 Tax=Microctonus aethiopoides TaxID=144406 RepID=A0AA39FUI2_9HYME|nr:hypothetical protein PV328_000254 [Microctonus aethiopoides]